MKEINLNNYARLVGGVFLGLVSGAMLSVSINTGAIDYFKQLDSLNLLLGYDSQPFGYELVWGGRWFVRGLTSLLCTAWGAFIAGVFARQNGNIVGIISALPTSILWLVYFFYAITGGEVYSTFMTIVMAAVLIVSSVYVAYLAGDEGHLIGSMYEEHFNSRNYTLFGIKWFHYLWIPIVLHLYIVFNAYMVARIYPIAATSFTTYGGIMSLIIFIILFPYYYSYYLSYIGLGSAFFILTDINHIDATKERVLAVCKYGFLFPISGILIQFAMTYLLKFISGFFIS